MRDRQHADHCREAHRGKAEKRDGDHWGVTFLDLAQRGIEFQDVVSDGANRLQGLTLGLQDEAMLLAAVIFFIIMATLLPIMTMDMSMF